MMQTRRLSVALIFILATALYAVTESDLAEAIDQGNMRMLSAVVKVLGADASVENGTVPGVVYAARQGKTKALRYLISMKANLDARAREDNLCQVSNCPTALIIAACEGRNEMVKHLVEAGASLDLKTLEGTVSGTEIRMADRVSAIACAAYNGHKETYDLLAAAGAKDEVPLHSAVLLGETDTVSRMIEQGANLDQCDGYLYSPLMHAVKQGNAEMVRILLKAKASPDIPRQVSHETVDGRPRTTFSSTYLIGSEPIYMATKAKNVEVVRMLLEAKADPNVSDMSKHTPLWLAVEAGNIEIVRFLLAARASVNVRDRQGELLIDMAKRIKSDPQILQLLSEFRAQ